MSLQKAPEVEAGSGGSGNLSTQDLVRALSRGSRTPSTPAKGKQADPAPTPDPEENEPDGSEEQGAPTPNEQEEATPPATEGEETQQPDPGQTEDEEGEDSQPSEGEAKEPKATLDDAIAQAIKDAGMAGDKAKAVQKLVKRLAALADQRDSERNRRLELERKLQGQTSEEPTHAAAVSTAVSDEVAVLDERIDHLERALETLDANPDGMTIQTDNGQIELSAEQVKQQKLAWKRELRQANTDRVLKATQASERAARLRSESDALALRHYGWVNDRQSELYQLAQAELRELGPHAKTLASMPQFAVIMGRYIRGLQAERAESAKPKPDAVSKMGKVSTQARQAPPVVPGPGVKARPTKESAELKAARAEWEKTRSSKALGRLMALEQSQNQAA